MTGHVERLVGDGGEVPLSFPQQLLWFFDHLRPGGEGPGFTLREHLVLTGAVDTDALRSAVEDVTARHDVLRTVVRSGPGVPHQRVVRCEPATLDVVDLRRDNPEAATERFWRRATSWMFDPEKPPLLRVFLGDAGDDRWLLSIVVHHSVCDGWSLPVLVGDLAAFYRARVDGAAPPPPLDAQYADYARWQHRAGGEPATQAAIAYWRDQLDGVRGVHLPADRPGAFTSGTTRGVRADLPDDVDTASLRAFATRQRMTPFMVPLAAYDVLLSAITGAEDVSVPTLTAGRSRRAFENLAGFFLNAVLLRTRVAAGDTFLDVATRVRATCIAAYEHWDLPLLRVIDTVPDVAMLLADEDYVIMPFQVVEFSDRDKPISFGQACRGAPIYRVQDGGEQALPLDGLVTVDAGERSLRVVFDYSAEVFHRDRIEHAANAFGAIVQAALIRPDTTVSTLMAIAR